jgi:hypothetical protein
VDGAGDGGPSWAKRVKIPMATDEWGESFKVEGVQCGKGE